MAKFTFSLPKAIAKEGIQHIGGKYNFENGELTVEESVARKIKPILTNFYGCSVSQAQATQEEVEAKEAQASEGDAVLSKTSTKATPKNQ